MLNVMKSVFGRALTAARGMTAKAGAGLHSLWLALAWVATSAAEGGGRRTRTRVLGVLAAVLAFGLPSGAALAQSAQCAAINNNQIAAGAGNNAPGTLSGTYAIGNQNFGGEQLSSSNYSDFTQAFAPGEVISYSWTRNSGAGYVQVILQEQSGFTLRSGSTENITAASGSGSVTVGAANDVFNIAVTNYSIDAANGVINAAESGRNNSSVTFTISCSAGAPTLGVGLSHSGTPKQGSTFTLLPTVSNSGAGATSGAITLTSTLPTGLTYVSATGTNWDCSASSGVNLSCAFSGAIAAGASNNALSVTVAAAANSATPRNVTVGVSGGGASNTPTASDNIAIARQPVVTAVSPTAGPTGGGTTVTITGSSFTGTAGAGGVKFGGTNATGYTIISDTQISATAPARAAGTVDVTVTNGGATSATSAGDQYTYVAAPTVTAVSPTAGPTAGGSTVVITGTGFAAAPGTGAVKFGATNATYTINSNTQITATAPANSAGTYDVTVTTPGGTSATSAADQFTYIAAPTVTSISPTAGPTAGGTSVTITGANFTGVTAVTFGGTAATGFTFNSATSITATAPAGSAGTVDIRVTTGGGTSATSAADQFTYISAPTVTSVSPTAGPTAGGQTVTITGTGFAAAPGTGAVRFGATNATYTINSSTQITATAPANSAGTYDITVTTPGGTSATSAADQFTYISAPTVTSVSVGAGPTGGGVTVVITGTGFAAASPTGAVHFGAATATYTINSNTQITATSPANPAGTYDIRVTTPGGTSATSFNDQFTYVAAPTVTSVSPTAGPTGGGTTVTITGTGFAAAPGTGAVRFGATTATYTINSNTQITATSPANSAGTYDITVATPGGTSAASAQDQFTYVAAPTVTGVSPTSGPTSGGTTVTITGTGFAAAPGTGAVRFGATTATYTINSNTQITATSPANSGGTYDITVTTLGGASATSASDQFTYVAPPVASSQTFGSIVGYNDGSNQTTSIPVYLFVTGGDAPTSFAVGSATTAQGGSVSIDSSGNATYTPPVGFRNGNDSFTYTATNSGGTSAPATVTMTMGNPTITVALPSSAATVEREYNAGGSPVTVDGGRAAYTVNSISGLPSGLVDAGGGVISGTPAANGTFTVTVNVTDSSTGAGPYTANATATLMVGLPPAPVVNSFSINGLTYNSGSATATTFSAAPHSTESPTGYQVGASSYGATVSVDSAGLMSYTPPVGFRGTDTFNYVSTNAGGTSNVGQVFVTVNDPVFTVTLPAATGTVGEAYNSGFSVVNLTGGNAPYTNFSATGLPAGLTMNSSGVISGTPTTATNATVVVTATDNSGGNGSYTSTASASLVIAAPTIALSPASGALPGAQVGTAYAQGLTSTGGVAPITYDVTAGALPPGLSLSTDGVISGTPTATGTYNFTVTGTDSSGNDYNASASYSITAIQGVQTIVFDPLSDAQLSSSPAALSATSSSGLAVSFASTTTSVCTVSGVSVALHQLGTCSITASQAGDGDWNAAPDVVRSFTVIPDDLVITPGAASGLAVGVAYSHSNTASGGVAPYTYQLSAGAFVPGTTLNPATGVVSGTPTVAGSFSYIIGVSDSQSPTVTAQTGVTTVTIAKGDQTLAFTSTAPSATAPGPDYTVAATATSGLGVIYSLDASSTGCSLSGTTVSFTEAGTCVINANQAGDSNWNAAAQVQQSFTVVASPPIAADLSGVAIAYNSTGTAIDLSGSISGGAHTSIAIGSAPAHGTVSVSGDVITYTPAAGYFGTDSFTWTATGLGGTSNTATVSLAVATPAAPTASDVSSVAVGYNDAGVAIDLSGSVSGVRSSLAIATAPAHGTVSLAGEVVTYTPTTGYFGPDAFTYTAAGPGGTSAPATVSLSVATPPPPVIDTPAGPVVLPPAAAGAPQPVVVNLGAQSDGVIDGFRITTTAEHGTAVISKEAALAQTSGSGPKSAPGDHQLIYTPAANFMGTDTVTLVAYGPGGDSTPVTFTFQVAGKAPDLSGTTPSNGSLTFNPTSTLVGGPFQALRITRAPDFGTATVNGLTIVFTPGAANGGSTSLDYVIDLPFGSSAAGRIDLVSNIVPGAQALTAETVQGHPVTVRISDVVGGPFTGAAVVSISPTSSGTATIAGSGGTYDLTFTPTGTFSGEATVTFSLTNAFGTTNGTLAVTVEARPDPGLDPEVRGVATSQVTSARRFADAQISNFQRRLRDLHDGTNGSANGLGLNLGFGAQNDADNDPRVALRRQLSNGRETIDPDSLGLDRERDMLGLDLWAGRPVQGADAFGPGAVGPGAVGLSVAPSSASSDGRSTVGFWTAGSVDWGRQDASGQRDYRFTTQGVTAGLDVRVSDQLIVGGGLGYGEDKTRIGDNGSVSTGRGLTGALYATWLPAEAFYVDGVVGWSDLDFDSRRWTTGIGGDPDAYAEGERSGDTRFLSAAFGRILTGESMTSELYARLDARSISLGGFTETGAGMSSLTWDAVDQESVSANLGASWRWVVDHRQYGQFWPSARLEWSHEFEDIGDQGVRYADWAASPTYLVPLDAWSRDSLRLEFGADWAVNDRLVLGFGYRGGFGDAGSTHGGEIRAKVDW